MIWKRDEVNRNNGVKWRRFIVPKKVEQINDHLFIDTYKSNNINIGVNENMHDSNTISKVITRFQCHETRSKK